MLSPEDLQTLGDSTSGHPRDAFQGYCVKKTFIGP